MPSPDISGQMGVQQPPPPGTGLSQLQPMGAGGPPAPGATNPHGFLMAQADTVKKVLAQMAAAEQGFAPFAQKATQVIDVGVSAISSTPPGAPGSGTGPTESGTGGPGPMSPGGTSQVPALG